MGKAQLSIPPTPTMIPLVLSKKPSTYFTIVFHETTQGTMWIPACVCSPVRDITANTFALSPRRKAQILPSASLGSFSGKRKTFPSLTNRCSFLRQLPYFLMFLLPQDTVVALEALALYSSFSPLTMLSSCLVAEASKQVLPVQSPLHPSSPLDTHTCQDPAPLPVVHISCATSHSSLEAIPSSSAHCMFSCPCAACMLPVISKETG